MRRRWLPQSKDRYQRGPPGLHIVHCDPCGGPVMLIMIKADLVTKNDWVLHPVDCPHIVCVAFTGTSTIICSVRPAD